jgi:FlaA1/EpsC-like NDP-sugar epimerase
MAVWRPRLRAGFEHQADPVLHRSPAAGEVGWGAAGVLVRLAGHIRRRHLVVLDVAVIMIAACAALAFRMDRISAPFLVAGFPPAMAALVMAQLASNVAFGLYNRQWRHASVPDLVQIVRAAVIGTIAGAALFYGLGAILGAESSTSLPRSFWPIEFVLTAGALGGVRLAIRAAADVPRTSRAARTTGPRRTLLYGAGRAGTMLARSARRDPSAGVLPVGFLDDDPALAGTIVAGQRVFGGLDAMPRAVAETGAQTMLIALPSADGTAVRRVVDAALALGLEIRIVPSLTSLLEGSIDARRARGVRLEDLLRRPIVQDHPAEVDEIIRGRRVMITGAGGSIGSELARQVFALAPECLILVDRAESPLYLVQRELETRRERGHGSGELRVHLANVATRAAMRRLVRDEAPAVILHAAAYKHVPMMEDHPSDAVQVNVGGTLALLDAAEAAGVERFVLVSTDKAVRPSSVMGASKRLAEMLVADAAARLGRPYVSVRFGNVLGSTGSVVPIFQEQLENGEPLTITDAEMTRFFMTIPEAAWLILDAAALGRNGDLFVLDMGEPVRIMDLAHDLVRLSGRDPRSHPIEFVGLRPGEKLHEELFYDTEHVEPTASAKVLRVTAPPAPRTIREDAQALQRIATGDNEVALAAAILRYVREADAPGRDLEPQREARAFRIEPVGVGHELSSAAGWPTP